MRRFSAALAGGALLGLAGCGGGGANVPGGKATPEELGRAVMESLVKRDKAGLLALYATADGVLAACPDMADMRDKLMRRMAKSTEAAAVSFEACLSFDWINAKPVSAEGGEQRGADANCHALTTLRDYVLEVDIGGQRVELRIEDPVQLGSSLFLDDRIECRLAQGAPIAAPPPAPAAPVPPPPAPSPAPGSAPVPGDLGAVCNRFIASYEACIAMLPEASRPPLIQALGEMRQSWSAVTDAAGRDANCLRSKESMKAGLGAMCPGLFD